MVKRHDVQNFFESGEPIRIFSNNLIRIENTKTLQQSTAGKSLLRSSSMDLFLNLNSMIYRMSCRSFMFSIQISKK